MPFVDSGAADTVPGGELPAGDGVAGAWRAARGGDLISGGMGLAGLVEVEAVVVERGDGDQAELGPAQDGVGGDAEAGRELPAGEKVLGACGPAGGFGAVLAGVVEAFSASVGAPAGDQAAPVPLADRLRGHLQVGGYLAGGEHAGGAEPAGVRAQAACVAERGQVLHGEGPAPAAGDSPAVEDRGDLVEGVVVQELAKAAIAAPEPARRLAAGLAAHLRRWPLR